VVKYFGFLGPKAPNPIFWHESNGGPLKQDRLPFKEAWKQTYKQICLMAKDTWNLAQCGPCNCNKVDSSMLERVGDLYKAKGGYTRW
jgi:hypothetical protein